MVDTQPNNDVVDESIPQPTSEKGIIPSDQNIQQMEIALRELLERQTRDLKIAAEAMKRAEAMAAKQQALLEEAEKRDQELKEKLRNRLTYTWKPSVVVGNPPAKENSKHPFSLAILSEELPKKFKYPTDMEPYVGSSDPKHHLDAFDNRMVLLNASDATKCKAFSTAVKTDRDKKEASRKDLPQEDRSRREQRSGRSYYNPLNVSLTTFLHEVSQVERIPAPRAIKVIIEEIGMLTASITSKTVMTPKIAVTSTSLSRKV
ncbi:hypothetical protein PIB30_018624 [Stylosanthes scabra]|uniref:Uncharacterized protein n=1 Tax=Stylosanthes scabra TaxID=79078 RepID=A0ABU6T981_9FABA|nr:hypothetical protein [Stylosanthes scabra]